MRRDESGAIVIIVALAMVALLGLAALVVDLGGLYGHDRDLQTMADAGALAGAMELIYSQGDQGLASTKAQGYVATNAQPNSQVVLGNVGYRDPGDNAAAGPITDNSGVFVGLREDRVPFVFAPVIGQSEGAVRAQARAEVKYLTGLEKLFPVAILYMNPDKFRFVVSGVGSFDVTDTDKDGVFGESGEGGGTLPAAAPLYGSKGGPALARSVGLQAISVVNGVETPVLDLPDIGLWRVADPGNPEEVLYHAGMSESSGYISVRAQVASTVTAPTLTARLGGTTFNLSDPDGDKVYQGGVNAPSASSNDGFATFDLVITFPATGGKGGKAVDVTAARYIAFNPDVPLISLMMEPSFYAGYSRITTEAEFQRGLIATRRFQMGDTYVMKLGSHTGSGLYSGNWRTADIWLNQNTQSEIGAVDIPPDWHLTVDPLRIGGELEPETGAKPGPIIHGLNERLAPYGNSAPADDPRRVVIIPIVNYAPDLHGTSQRYTITGFAAFRITNYSQQGPDKGEIEGQFIHWAEPGSWQDNPPGPLYVETAILTR